MRYTVNQYDRAIMALERAKTQLAPNGHGCHICTGSDHQAWECSFNPLRAAATCEAIAKDAERLHRAMHKAEGTRRWPESILGDFLHSFVHYLAGFEWWMGLGTGPAHVYLPEDKPVDEAERKEHARELKILEAS